jgi:hypothetical protein
LGFHMAGPRRILDYFGISRTPSETRRFAIVLARWNGIVALLLGMGCFMAIFPAFLPHSRMSLEPVFLAIIMIAYDITSLVSGILYIVASATLQQSRRGWELAVMISALIHGFMILVMLGLNIYVVAVRPTSPDASWWKWAILIHALLAISVLVMFDQIKWARRGF